MFDDLFDVFDRDRTKRDRNAGSPRGVRGFLARLTGDDEADDQYCRSRRHHGHDDVSMDRSSHRRRRDGFDLDD